MVIGTLLVPAPLIPLRSSINYLVGGSYRAEILTGIISRPPEGPFRFRWLALLSTFLLITPRREILQVKSATLHGILHTDACSGIWICTTTAIANTVYPNTDIPRDYSINKQIPGTCP